MLEQLNEIKNQVVTAIQAAIFENDPEKKKKHNEEIRILRTRLNMLMTEL